MSVFLADAESDHPSLVYGNSFTSDQTGFLLFAEKWGRFALSYTIVWMAIILWTIFSVIIVPLALLLGLIKQKKLLYLRIWAVITIYLIGEVRAVFSLFIIGLGHILVGNAYLSAPYRAAFTRYGMYWCASMCHHLHYIFGKTMHVEGDFVPDAPVVAAVQHVSTNDVLLVPWILGYRHQLNMRIVMKKELMWDPAVEMFGTGSGSFFINRNRKGSDEIAGIEKMMSSRGDVDVDGRFNGSIIFPEGTRMTPAKQNQVLKSMKKDSPLYEFASSLKATLPPRLGGLLALLKTKTADLVFVAHVGYDGATDMTTIFKEDGSGIFYSPLTVKMWRIQAQDIPETEEGKTELILRYWKQLDEWVFQERMKRVKGDGGAFIL